MEFTPERWLNVMTRQTAALAKPTAQYVDATLDWLDERLVLYGRRGTAKAANVIEIFRYAARRYGVRWFVVDNLAKCGIAEDDYNGQKAFVDALGDFANDQRAHVVLCAHLRKSESDQRQSNRMDVKGSGAISDMADNVWLIRRNRRKEKAAQVDASDHQDEPDVWFSADKVRDGDCEPLFRLWFHADSHQFVERENGRPRQYVAWTNAAEMTG
jgi:twinkle protein